MIIRAFTLVLATALALAGCDNFGRANVAVVDLDMVAKAFSHDDTIQAQVTAANQQLSQQLSSVALDLQNQLQVQLDELGESPSDEEQSQFQQLRSVAQQRLQQTQLLAQQRSQEFRTLVINQFRQDIRGVAAEVAKANGASVILTTTPNLLWIDAAVDITDEVIAALRENGFQPSQIQVNVPDPSGAADGADGSDGADAEG